MRTCRKTFPDILFFNFIRVSFAIFHKIAFFLLPQKRDTEKSPTALFVPSQIFRSSTLFCLWGRPHVLHYTYTYRLMAEAFPETEHMYGVGHEQHERVRPAYDATCHSRSLTHSIFTTMCIAVRRYVMNVIGKCVTGITGKSPLF